MDAKAEKTPLNLLDILLSEEDHLQVEEGVKRIPDMPKVIKLGELVTPSRENNPEELIQWRFLCKGGICLLVGPTGIGKSSLIMQIMVHLSVGRGLFMLVPGSVYQKKGMNILYVQNENDSGDLAEMRDGVMRGCEDLSDEERELAQKNVTICTINDRVSDAFAATLDSLLEVHGPFDLLVIDPAFGYLGAEANNQNHVSHFMRELMNPILTRHNVGLILIHHQNKPPKGKEKDGWSAGELAYAGSGHSEWANAARAVLVIRSLGHPSIFEFVAGKRGQRASWRDANDIPTLSQYIAHHTEAGTICWRTPSLEEVSGAEATTKPGPKQKVDFNELLACVEMHPGQNQRWYAANVAPRFECGATTIQNALLALCSAGLLDEIPVGRSKCYSISFKGREHLKDFMSKAGWDKIGEGLMHE